MPGRATGATLATGGDFSPARLVLIDQRRLGVPFDTAWECALQAVCPNDRATLRETSGAWQAEYEGRRTWGGDLMAAFALVPDNDNGMTPGGGSQP